MAKQEPITVKGTVTEVSGRGVFIVELENGHSVTCHPSGKMRMYNINIMAGDQVDVEISPYDLTKGRIVHRTITKKR